MTKNPAYIGTSASIFDALNLLNDLDVRHLPVVENGQLKGIISDRDMRSFSASELEKAKMAGSVLNLSSKLSEGVSNYMSGSVFFVNPESPITEVIEIMLDQKVGAIPVIDTDNTLVGIVSYMDIIKVAEKIL